MNFILQLRTLKSGSLVITVPLYIRILMLLMAGIVFAASFFSSFSAGSIAVIVILLLAACYEERWHFDRQNQQLSFRFGLLFLAKKVEMPFATIRDIVIENFTKRRSLGKSTTYYRLVLYSTDEQRLIIESVVQNKLSKLTDMGKAIATTVGKELTIS